jgi:hypothetical protein
MGQSATYAAVKDAQNKLVVEVCASCMEQRSNVAAVTDAQIMLKMEDCAEIMEQRSRDAAAKDAQIMPSVEECVEGTGRIAMHTMHLLHLDQNMSRLPQLKPYQTSVFRELRHQRARRKKRSWRGDQPLSSNCGCVLCCVV